MWNDVFYFHYSYALAYPHKKIERAQITYWTRSFCLKCIIILLLLLLGEFDLQSLLGTIAKDVRKLLLAGDHIGAFGTLSVELNRIKLALGSTDTAANTLVGINNACTAT